MGFNQVHGYHCQISQLEDDSLALIVMAKKLHRCPKTHLPPEILLFHILPKLPAESLLRFICVSKEWHSFIKMSELVKMHLHHVTDSGNHRDHLKLLLLSQHPKSPVMFGTIDCEAPEDGLSVCRPFPFKHVGKRPTILASSHGLLCIGVSKEQDFLLSFTFSDIVLWNPLMGDHKTLSKAGSHRAIYEQDKGAFGLYHTSCDNDYKLLRLTFFQGVYIYSLKSDSWRKLKLALTKGVQRKLAWRESCRPNTALLNDKLYIFIDESVDRLRIIRFDIKTEEFTFLKIPFWISHMKSFTVFKGCIHFFVKEKSLKTALWKMDGDDEHWTRFGSSYLSMQPLHSLAKNGNWLINSKRTSSIYELCSKNDAKKFVCSYATSGHSMYVSERNKFVGTLVSPNRC